MGDDRRWRRVKEQRIARVEVGKREREELEQETARVEKGKESVEKSKGRDKKKR